MVTDGSFKAMKILILYGDFPIIPWLLGQHTPKTALYIKSAFFIFAITLFLHLHQSQTEQQLVKSSL